MRGVQTHGLLRVPAGPEPCMELAESKLVIICFSSRKMMRS